MTTGGPDISQLSADEKRVLLARLLRKQLDGTTDARPPGPSALAAGRRDAPLPASWSQERMWFAEQVAPGNPGLIVPLTLRLRGRLDHAALERALNAIVQRHEILRTSFTTEQGRVVQVVAPSAAVELPVRDLTHLPEASRVAEAQRLLSETAAPVDLSEAPLLRAMLFRLSDTDHIVHVALHHIVADAWSLGVFGHELGRHYQAFAAGQAPSLPELPQQYADFAVWQRRQIDDGLLDQQLAYWKEQLRDCPPPLELPTDRPRPEVHTARGEWHDLTLSETVTRAVDDLSRQESATPFMTLLAAFTLLLRQYSGQDDIVVGTPVAGRQHANTQGLIGVFINNLVLRTDLSGEPTFRDVVRRVRRMALDAYKNQDVPFERLLEELRPVRDLSRTPLFQVAINMLNFRNMEFDFDPLAVEPLGPLDAGSNFDLTLYCGRRNDRYELRLVYNTDLFEAATAEAVLGQFGRVLVEAAGSPDSRIGELAWSTAALAGPAVPEPAPTNPYLPFEREAMEQSIGDRFAEQVRRHPDRLAVKTRTVEWTYGDLDALSEGVAAALDAHDLGPDGNVALLFDHEGPMIAALFGALKVGRTYVPLDTSYPARRLEHILADSAAAIILTDTANLARAHALAGGRVPVADVRDCPAPASPPDHAARVMPDTAAYILYTSGSTGEPKGVVQNHRNVLHHIRNYTNRLHIAAEDRLALVASYSFDAAVMDIFGALLNGAALCPLNVRVEGVDALAGWLVEQNITIFHATPTVYRYFCGAQVNGAAFPCLRLVVLGGEEVTRRDVDLFRRTFGSSCILVNGLGPTESTVTLQHFIGNETGVDRRLVPVGWPVEDTDVYVLNTAGEPVPPFGVGEIVIRSAHVALGYWRKPELTRAAFSADPNGGARRRYRTGDLGRRLPDGSIEFIGRRDAQVKVRGHRVEPGEVEGHLLALDGIAEAAVIADGESGQTRLVAYVVSRNGWAPSTREVRVMLREHLPEYMLPALVIPLARLPLTATGKLDRRALPPPSAVDADAQETVAAPRTPIEAQLVRLWEEVLGTSPIGVRDSFFDLGGHSLLAVRLFARIREELGRNVPLTTLLEEPTIEHVARALEQHAPDSAWSAVVPIQSRGSQRPLFCVHGLGGYVSCFAELARMLGPDQPFYGIQARGLDGVQEPLARVEDMATAYLAEVQEVQPEGPYYLAGFSTGGAIALEMAQQLQAAGHEVRLLVMVDSAPRTLANRRHRWKPRSLRHFFRELPFWTSVLRSLSTEERLASARFAWAFFEWSVRAKLDKRLGSGSGAEKIAQALEARATSDLPEHHRQLRQILRQAGWEYEPRPYRGRLTLLRSTRYLFVYSFDRRMGWDDVALEVDVESVPGDHESILAVPQVQVLAEKLRRALAEAHAGWSEMSGRSDVPNTASRPSDRVVLLTHRESAPS